MYEFLADEEWWKHSKQIEESFDKLGEYLPDITFEELKKLKVPHVIVYSNPEDWSNAKPVYVLTTKKWPLCCWIKVKHEEPSNSPG